MGGRSMKDKQKQTQTSRVIEAVCESHVRQHTLWRNQQLVCTQPYRGCGLHSPNYGEAEGRVRRRAG